MGRVLSAERMDLALEAYDLYTRHNWTFDRIAKHQERSPSTIARDVERIERLESGDDDSERYTWKYRLQYGCERCGLIREDGRLDGVFNPNADALCDSCHLELLGNVLYEEGELSNERILDLGYEPVGKSVLVILSEDEPMGSRVSVW